MKWRNSINITAIIVALGLLIIKGIPFAIGFLLIYFLVLKYPNILNLLGNYHYANNRVDKAGKYYQRVYKCFYSPVKLKIYYTYVLIVQGNLTEAEEIIKNILKQKITETESRDLKINHSLVMWKRGKLDNAIEILNKLYEKYKTIIIYQNLGYLLILKGEYTRALEINLEAYDYDASNAGIIDNLAQNYYMLGEYDKAEDLFEALMKKKPTFASAYQNYALLLLKKNKIEDALKSLRKATECKFTFLSAISKEEIENQIREIESIQEGTHIIRQSSMKRL